jgi:lipopolysaccharide export system permease protein
MTPILIERYIFKRALFATTIATLSLTGVVWVVKAFQDVDLVTSKGQSVLLYLYMTTLGVPTLIAVILPIAMLLGVMNCINGMNNDSELVVINASGASQSVILRPFLALGTLIALIVMMISLYYGPASLSTLRNFVTQVRSDLVSVLIKEGEFNKIGKNLIFHIAERANGGVLKGVFVQDERSKKEIFTYLAREGSIIKQDGNAYMLLKDGEIQRTSRKTSNISIIKYDSYAFDLSSLSGAKQSGSSLEELSTSELIYPNKNSQNFKKRPGAMRAEFHNRVTSGLYPFAFILIVLAISGRARSTRQGYATAIAMAFFLCIALRGGSIVAVNGSRSNQDLIALIYILPAIGIIIPSIYLFMGKQMAMPKFAQNWLDHMQIGIERHYKQWSDWNMLRRRRRSGVSS